MAAISLTGKRVLITGASSGIGRSCAEQFAAAGARLLLAARRIDRLETLALELNAEYGTDVYYVELDVRDRDWVADVVADLPAAWREIDILVNNAGLSRGLDRLHAGSIDDWDEMIDTNVKGLLYVSRAVIPGMVERNAGHVINIGSIAGRAAYPGGNVYCGSKAAVRTISAGLKIDLLGTAIRVSEVDPGLVETEFSDVRFHGDRDRAKKTYDGLTPLTPDDIADIVLFCATRPAHVNLSELLVVPTDQATATQVSRRG